VWLWARDGKVVASGAKGKADRERGIDNTQDTRFRIGSMNKMFTAVAILQLVERGKLSLDDTIGKILPDYPNTNVASQVKVRRLLSHTGGTGDIFGPQFDAHRLELKTLQDYVNLYGKRGLQFEPGARWDYSNYGFLLLGVIIEKISGKSYYDFVDENIYKVAGMTNSASEPESVEVPKCSKGYMRDRFDIVSNEPTLPWLHDRGGSDEVRRSAHVEQTSEAGDSRRSNASAIQDGGIRVWLPTRRAERAAQLRARRRRSGNERNSSRVSRIPSVSDRVVQPGPSVGLADR
jgi:CubicO group peptidase (beta-lactamase class C family)